MSKKDRLKKQSQKQLREKRELEEQEREEREAASARQSKSAKKMMRKAKYGRYGKEPLMFTLIKLAMLLPFAWSGVYYGLIMIFGTFLGYIDPKPPVWVGWCMLAGDVLVLAGDVSYLGCGKSLTAIPKGRSIRPFRWSYPNVARVR